MTMSISGTSGLTMPGGQTQIGALTSGAAVASTSGTSIDFTGIPSWVKRVTVMLNGVSTNGTSDIIVQLGDAGGFENTGYASTVTTVSTVATSTNFTAGFGITEATTAVAVFTGQVTINLLGSNFWSYGSVITTGGTTLRNGGGGKTLSDTLTQIRITTVGGANTFDAGSINILYE